MPVACTKTTVLFSSSMLPQSLSLKWVGSGHMSCLQRCVNCSEVMTSVLHGHISDSPTLKLVFIWALSLFCPVLSQQKDLFWSIQFVNGLTDLGLGVVASIYLFFLYFGEGFDDCLFIIVRGVPVLLVQLDAFLQLAAFPSEPVCLFVSLDLAVCRNPLPGLVCQGCQVDQSS